MEVGVWAKIYELLICRMMGYVNVPISVWSYIVFRFGIGGGGVAFPTFNIVEIIFLFTFIFMRSLEFTDHSPLASYRVFIQTIQVKIGCHIGFYMVGLGLFEYF